MTAARYKVVGGFFDGRQMHEDGAEVEYTGLPGENLAPLNAEAQKAKRKWLKEKPRLLAELEGGGEGQ